MMEGIPQAQEALKARLQKLKDSRALYFAVKDTKVQVSDRVWGQGKLTDGGEIKYKEDYEVYAYTPPSPKKVSGKGKPYKDWKRPPVKPKGKAQDITGGFYKSYLTYKDAMGRKETPIELTGRLRKAYFSDASLFEQSTTDVFIALSGENAAKYRGITDSKGEFLQLSQTEIDFFFTRLNALSQ